MTYSEAGCEFENQRETVALRNKYLNQVRHTLAALRMLLLILKKSFEMWKLIVKERFTKILIFKKNYSHLFMYFDFYYLKKNRILPKKYPVQTSITPSLLDHFQRLFRIQIIKFSCFGSKIKGKRKLQKTPDIQRAKHQD